MKVAFWSNVRGKSCVTSNLACISVLSALGHPGERTILFENHRNIINLGSTFFGRNPENIVCENGGYTVDRGLGKIMKFVERGERLSEETLFRVATDFLGRRLFYLPADGAESSETLEYQMNRGCVLAMEYLEECGDMVLIDTTSAPVSSSRKILDSADFIVVNLTQNRQMLSHFFRNYSAIRKKAFYLMGNYDERSELTREAVMREYGIPESRIGTIPYSIRFADAISDGELIPFLTKNYRCGKQNENYSFMAGAREAAELFCGRLSEVRDGGGSL